jgi:hypothetical protein
VTTTSRTAFKPALASLGNIIGCCEWT